MKIDISKVCAACVVFWTFVPPVQVGAIYRLIAILCLFVWFMLKGINMLINPGEERTYMLVAIITVVVRLCSMSLYYGMGNAFRNSLQMIIVFSIGMISMYYIRRDAAFLRKLIALSLILMCVFCVTTIEGLARDPYAARIANSEWLAERFKGNENVGLYGYVYMCVLIIPMLFNKIISHQEVSKSFDRICVISMILMIAMVMVSGYMIAIFCTILGCAVVVILHNRKSPKIVVFSMVALIFVLFYKEIIGGILETLMDATTDNPVYYNKFRDFRMLILGSNSSGETLVGRWKNYSRSLQEIVKYPVVGSYFWGKTLGGGHSFVFDTIGKMGWLTALLQFYMIYRYPFKLNRVRESSHISLAFILALLVFTTFDPLSQEISVATYLFFPFFHDLTAYASKDEMLGVS